MINYELALRNGLGLKVIARLSATHQIYKVKGERGLIVAKLSPRDKRVSYYLDLEREKNILTQAQDKRLSPLIDALIRTTGLRGFYYGQSEFLLLPEARVTDRKKATFYVLLKDFISGSNLGDNQLLDLRQGRIFRETIQGLHSAGLCSFDLSSENIRIERKTRIPHLIELAGCQTKEELSSNEFEEACVADLEEADRYCVG